MHYYRDEARYCFLLLSGSVALHRRGDGIILNSESAPFVLGVSSQHTNGHMYV
ncbi:TPA: cyclic nucleotide-binding protein, partial [Enterobacter roggenkampii]|nr:cyclic nucleotide-binding protein [Enterobacter roggenkampii]HDR2532577.1 cyclic nucleotide-binding protein [Enterobacter roggenkampii]